MAKTSAFQFSDPEMERFIFEKNNNVNFEEPLAGKLEFEFDVDDIDNQNETKGRLRVWNGTIDDIEEKNVPYIIDITFSSNFEWTEAVDDPMKMLRVNGQAMLMSYMRPVITSLLAFVRGPKMRIPFIDFTENGTNDD